MIQLIKNLWISDSVGIHNVTALQVGAILNVAQDLCGYIGWPFVEYMQVGLVDGPGNELSVYCAAVLALHSLMQRHEGVVVYDHSGARSLVVGIMYLSLREGRKPVHPSFQCRRGWQELCDEVSERVGIQLPEPHPEHVRMFGFVPFGLLEAIV